MALCRGNIGEFAVFVSLRLRKRNGGEMADGIDLSPTIKLFGSEITSRYGKHFGDAVWRQIFRRVGRDGVIPESSMVSIYEEFGDKKPDFKLFVLGFMGGTIGDLH